MRADGDGLPKVGEGGRYLGARHAGKFRDIDVDEDGMVHPESGGMSVSPPPPENLPEHRRPPRFGGYGEDPLYELHTDELPPELSYRPDTRDPERHGYIEPARRMTFEGYRRAIHETRFLWRLVR